MYSAGALASGRTKTNLFLPNREGGERSKPSRELIIESENSKKLQFGMFRPMVGILSYLALLVMSIFPSRIGPIES